MIRTSSTKLKQEYHFLWFSWWWPSFKSVENIAITWTTVVLIFCNYYKCYIAITDACSSGSFSISKKREIIFFGFIDMHMNDEKEISNCMTKWRGSLTRSYAVSGAHTCTGEYHLIWKILQVLCQTSIT